MGRARVAAAAGLILAAAGLILAAAACGGGQKTVTAGTATAPSPRLAVAAPFTIRLWSPAFANGSRIPGKYTCAGEDVSPPLRWHGVPAKTKTLALLMVDPDAPGGPFTHWALADIPPATDALRAGRVPAGTVQGRNGFGKTGYGGPCPPAGNPHHYLIELLALPRQMSVSPGFANGALAHQRPVAAGVLRGTYSRG